MNCKDEDMYADINNDGIAKDGEDKTDTELHSTSQEKGTVIVSSSDSDPDFSPSPRHQTCGLRPSRGSIPRSP
ncbi:hypothetical protein AVEN_126233-1 [Araneus ventricosus]|uniref:Uncharacterized protein n=1 Tax=Araneus ventricosus TaxID=182803 RepID=A0A4Y2T2F7_ARAVE|nr:hypothetical protein AVEN_126233-1 [Araneus ventricosus]